MIGAIVEANSGKQTLTVPVTLSGPANNTITIHYTITPGTATYSKTAIGSGGDDYGGKPTGTLTYRVNVAGKTPTATNIGIPIWADTEPDTTESFTITLSGLTGTGVTVIRANATVTVPAL